MSPPRTTILGNRLKEWRARHNMTQEALAQKVGVTRKTINTVENAVFIPSTVLALKLAQTLDAPVETLFFLANDLDNQAG